MVIHSLTPEQAVTLAFELAGGSESFERAEQLAWVGAMYPPELPSSDYSTGLALSVFLEVGDSPACKITGHKYIDAALYLQRHGYYREASTALAEMISEMVAAGEASAQIDPEIEAEVLLAFHLQMNLNQLLRPDVYTLSAITARVESLIAALRG